VTITIDANDARGVLGFSSSNQTIAEDVQSVTLMIERAGGDIGEVSLTYATVADTATAGSDFTETSGTLTWADGDATEQSINIAINNDDAEESDESFSVELSDPTNQATLGADSVTITIAANDTPIVVAPPPAPPPSPAPVTSNGGGGGIGWGLLALIFGFRLKRSISKP